MAHRGDCWPTWCPERLFAKIDSEWLQKMKKQFNRTETEKFVETEISGEVYINGNAFHDPLRVSVSIPTRLLEEALDDPHSSFCIRLKNDFKVCVSGGGDWRYMDLLPKEGGKLGATLYVMQKLGFTPEKTIVCGDSGNDIDMFCHPSILGCCVGNSHEVLVTFLKRRKDKLPKQNTAEITIASNGSPPSPVPPTERLSSDDGELHSEPFFLRDLNPTPHVCFSEYPCAGGILDSLRFFQFDSHIELLP